MINKLRSMAVFARVAESGSFRRAAERLGISASVVSHHVTQLEGELGVQLLYRSTRHVALTDAGRHFFVSCRAMLESAEEALAGLNLQEPAGRLWVVAPAGLSIGPFIQDVAEFCRRHPRVDLRLEFDDTPRNLIQEGIDLALCFGEQSSSSLVGRTLFHATPALFASPKYLDEHGAILTLEQLQNASWIRLGMADEIELRSPEGQWVRFRPRTRILVNNIMVLHELARSGLGLLEASDLTISDDIAAGRLVRVLPDWTSRPTPFYAVFPARAGVRALSRLFIDFICARLEALEMRRAAEGAA